MPDWSALEAARDRAKRWDSQAPPTSPVCQRVPMGSESLLTFQQAAERSGCCPKMLRRAVSSGDLAVIRLGSSAKSDRIHPDDLAAFWASRRYAAPPSPTIKVAPIKSTLGGGYGHIERLLAGGRRPAKNLGAEKLRRIKGPVRDEHRGLLARPPGDERGRCGRRGSAARP
jgi:hypothetical protein